MTALASVPAVTADQVLRAQGADPARVGARGGRVLALAERAVVEGMALVDPELRTGRHRVRRVHHDQVWLDGGMRIPHPGLAAGLVGAREITAVALTLGPRLEERVRTLADAEPGYAFALDGFGSVAIQALADQLRSTLGEEAQSRGLMIGRVLSPGMPGWPVVPGQEELLQLLDPPPASLSLTVAGMLVPAKSLTFLIGLGHRLAPAGHPCDYCDRGASCRQRPAS